VGAVAQPAPLSDGTGAIWAPIMFHITMMPSGPGSHGPWACEEKRGGHGGFYNWVWACLRPLGNLSEYGRT
jgi:hypothetical protein